MQGLPSTSIDLRWIEAEDLETGGLEQLEGLDGIIVPGGFGERGVEGKVKAVQYAREKGIPFFGISLGMQCAVIEYARNVAQLQQAGSVEFGDCTYPVISYRPGEPEVAGLGTSMRLGAYPCLISEDSLSMAAYQERIVSERHRHRYEVNRRYLDILVKAGMRVTGVSPDGQLVEIIELENHPWFVGTLFHPEFKSRPTNPIPSSSVLSRLCWNPVDFQVRRCIYAANESEAVGISRHYASCCHSHR